VKHGRFTGRSIISGYVLRKLKLWIFAALYFIAVLTPPCAYGWTGTCHRRLAALSVRLVIKANPLSSLSNCSSDSSEGSSHSSKEYLRALSDGSVVPDKRGANGWLPPSFHGLTPFHIGGEKLRGKAHIAFRDIMNGVFYVKGDEKELWFQSGRALHVIQDLCQPFHTGSGNNESLYHSGYEERVEERIDYFIDRVMKELDASKGDIDTFSCIASGYESFVDLPIKAANGGRSDFDELHRLCRQGEWTEGKWTGSMETLTIRCLLRATKLGARLIQKVEFLRKQRCVSDYGRFSGNCMATASALCGIIFILWMHYFIYCRG
jgi:hypothetical protein